MKRKIDDDRICVCCGREIPEGLQYCLICGYETKGKQRQIDRIRNMSVEELAEFLYTINNCAGLKCKMCPLNPTNCMCVNGIKEWLETEVEE
jgi:hypothetical protein